MSIEFFLLKMFEYVMCIGVNYDIFLLRVGFVVETNKNVILSSKNKQDVMESHNTISYRNDTSSF